MSFFGKLRSGAAGTTTTSTPTKKDTNLAPPTPLERLLQDAGSIRDDGSDKFFGMENFGNTCYCNSILQCLYYSVPFRDQVINYPRRAPIESILEQTQNAVAPPRVENPANPNSASAQAATAVKKPINGPSSSKSPGPNAQPQKPEDKDSPEYKKKQAITKGPLLPMVYDNATQYGMKESLFTALKDVFEAIIAHQSRIGIISPYKFLEVLRRENEMFRTSMHQDAHEFLNLVLNEVVANVEANSRQIEADKRASDGANLAGFGSALASATKALAGGESVKTSTNTGWVHELFEGTLTSETKCLTCENVSQRDEAFLDLSVDLDQHSSVTSCLRKFSEEEMLCERNKFHCDRCGGLQEAEKRMKIKRLPKILALHLKRFKYTEDLQRLQKLFHRVVYPYHLRLFNTTDDAEDPDRLYELYAVVVHIGGGPYHGHYVSIIKTQDRGWLLFDDEMVEPVDKSYVRNFFGDRPGLACAYVLFYQETTLEAVKKEQEAEAAAAVAKAAAAEMATATATPVKESHGLGLSLKTNGHAPNGIHQTPITATPLSPISAGNDETSPLSNAEPQFEPLGRAQTSPVLTTKDPKSPLSPLSSPFRVLTSKKSDLGVMSTPLTADQQQQQQYESTSNTNSLSRKERKAAEKELKEKEKERKKDMENRARDAGRRVKEEEAMVRMAIAASKRTAAEEKQQQQQPGSGNTGNPVTTQSERPTDSTLPIRTPQQPPHASTASSTVAGSDYGTASATPTVTNLTTSTSSTTSATTDTPLTFSTPAPPPTNAAQSPGGAVAGTLNRFRQSSKSMSKKPKFWSSKSELKVKGVGSGLEQDESAIDDGETAALFGGGPGGEGETKAEGKDKKNRFSIRKMTGTKS